MPTNRRTEAALPTLDASPRLAAPDLTGWPSILATLLLAAGALAAGLTFWLDGILLGPAVQNGSARGTAATMGLVACPVLAGSIVAARRGSALGLLGWLGSSAFLLYNAQLLLYATPFNRLFLLYVATLALAGWSITLVLRRALPVWAAGGSSDRFPARGIAVYVWVVVGLNAMLWLRTIGSAVTATDPPSFLAGTGTTTNPVFVQDLALWLPLMAVAAGALWRGRGWGRLVVGSVLVMWVIESISVATDQWMAHQADPASNAASPSAVPLFASLALVGLVPVALFARELHVRRRADLAPQWAKARATSGRRRVVVEANDFALGAAAANTLTRAGFEVAQCAGPDADHRCPLTVGGVCSLVGGADLVVNLLEPGAERAEVLAGLHRSSPDRPVVVGTRDVDPLSSRRLLREVTRSANAPQTTIGR
jgi:hypothetical protein